MSTIYETLEQAIEDAPARKAYLEEVTKAAEERRDRDRRAVAAFEQLQERWGSGHWTGRTRTAEMPRRHGPSGPRPRGVCPVCGSDVAIRKGGIAQVHGAPGNSCAGTAQPVRQEQQP